MLRTLCYLVFSQNRSYSFSSNQTSNPTGWTLLEIMIVSAVIAILASLAIPSVSSMMAKNQAQSTLLQIKGTLREAQRNAIRMGKECRISMNPDINPTSLTVDSNTQYQGCLSSAEVDLEGLSMKENFPGTGIRFSYKGNTTNIGTIVVESSNSATKYCLVVSNFLGIMRSGVYEPPQNEISISANSCKTSI